MNNQTQEALKMAINFASVISETYSTGGEAEKVINACKEALEQPAQKPVALSTSNNPFNSERHGLEVLRNTHPHQWQGLTDDDMSIIFDKFDWKEIEIAGEHLDLFKFSHAIEQALKEKNHA